jgi:small subunit ribosomal protein S6
MRIYEELFIVSPEAPAEEIDALVEQLRGVVTSGGGSVDKVDKWGVRKLAYRVRKHDEGYYVLLVLSSGPEAIKELERRLRVSPLVVKFLTVRIDERLKKIEKRRKEREKRAKRKPAPAAAAGPGRPAPAPGPAPAPAPAAPAPDPALAEPVVESAPKEA